MFQASSAEETSIANAQAIGVYRKLEELQDLSYSEYYTTVTGEDLPTKETESED